MFNNITQIFKRAKNSLKKAKDGSLYNLFPWGQENISEIELALTSKSRKKHTQLKLLKNSTIKIGKIAPENQLTGLSYLNK